MRRCLVLMAAGLALLLPLTTQAERPEYLKSYNDGTQTWVWYWDWNNGGRTACLQGYYDDHLSDSVCGVSPTPTGKVIVPSTVVTTEGEEVNVTALDYNLFKNCAEITEVELPDTVQVLGDDVFSGCSALATINVPSSLKSVRGDILNGTAWLAAQTGDFIVFGTGFLLHYQGVNANVSIPNSVEVICSEAFCGNDTLVSVTIPDSVTEIGESAFEACEKLATVNGAMNVVKVGNETFTDTKLWADATDNAPVRVANMIVGYKGDLESEIEIADGVMAISDNCFEGCEFTTISLPDSLQTIGSYAFNDCEALVDIEIPEGVTSIGEGAFASTAIESVEIPDSVTELGEDVFEGCDALWSLVIGSGLTELPYLGGMENLESVEIHVQKIPDDLFGGYENLVDVTLGEEVEEIGAWAFCGCTALESITIPESVTFIGEEAFYGCTALESVEFEGDMNEIEMDLKSAFYDTPWLEEFLRLPLPENDNFINAIEIAGTSGRISGWNIDASLEEDEDTGYLYNECPSEATVWYRWTALENGAVSFGVTNADFDTIIGVYRGASINALKMIAFNDDTDADEYQSFTAFNATAGETYYIAVGGYSDGMGTFDLVWAPYEYHVYFEIENDVLRYAYADIWPEIVTIPEGVTNITEGAFEEGYGLQTVQLPTTLKSIGEYAFAYTSLKALEGLRDNVKIGRGAFYATPYNETCPFKLLIDDGCVIGFIGVCVSAVEIPDGVTNIAELAFSAYSDDYWYEVYDAEKDDWVSYTFMTNLQTVAIPDSVVSISSDAFSGCENLATVTIANPDILINGMAFEDCRKIQSFGLEKKHYIVIGWDLFREKNPTKWIPGYYDDNDNWINGHEEEYIPDFMPVGTVMRIDNIEPLIAGGIPSDTGAMVTNNYLKKDGTLGTEVLVATNWLNEVWAKPVWAKDIPDLFDDEKASALNSAFNGNTTYTGWLRNAGDAIVGTISVKAAKPDKSGVSKLTATVTMLSDGKKQTFKGEAKTSDSGAVNGVQLTGKTGSLSVSISGDALTAENVMGGLSVSAAKDVFASKDAKDKPLAASIGKGTWGVTFASANGYLPLSLSVANKGKVKVAGTLPNGSKVSVNAQAIVTDGTHWCVPVVFSKKAKLGFVAWFEKGETGTILSEVSDVTPFVDEKGTTVELEVLEEACGNIGSLSDGNHAFSVSADDFTALGIAGTLTDLLPTNEIVSVAGAKWTIAKAAKVSAKNGVLSVNPGVKDGTVENASGLKLTFKAKDGSFKGSFTVYSMPAGKLVKTKFTVAGIIVNGTGYGLAYNKKIGSVPVEVR